MATSRPRSNLQWVRPAPPPDEGVRPVVRAHVATEVLGGDWELEARVHAAAVAAATQFASQTSVPNAYSAMIDAAIERKEKEKVSSATAAGAAAAAAYPPPPLAEEGSGGTHLLPSAATWSSSMMAGFATMMAGFAAAKKLGCKRCGTTDVDYNPVQTRSADEPMTMFCTCLNPACRARWRI